MGCKRAQRKQNDHPINEIQGNAFHSAPPIPAPPWGGFGLSSGFGSPVFFSSLFFSSGFFSSGFFSSAFFAYGVFSPAFSPLPPLPLVSSRLLSFLLPPSFWPSPVVLSFPSPVPPAPPGLCRRQN